MGLVDRAEYKRRQMPPGVRISGKAFGKDRRMPITNHYRPTVAPAPRARCRRTGRVERGGTGGCLTSDTVGPRRHVARPGSGGVPAAAWVTTAALVGEYRWIEHALYRLLGAWVRRYAASPPSRSTSTPRACATPGTPSCGPSGCPCWPAPTPTACTVPSTPTERPVRRAVGRGAGRPSGPARPGRPPTGDDGRPPGALPRLAGLYRVVLPRLVTSYRAPPRGGQRR